MGWVLWIGSASCAYDLLWMVGFGNSHSFQWITWSWWVGCKCNPNECFSILIHDIDWHSWGSFNPRRQLYRSQPSLIGLTNYHAYTSYCNGCHACHNTHINRIQGTNCIFLHQRSRSGCNCKKLIQNISYLSIFWGCGHRLCWHIAFPWQTTNLLNGNSHCVLYHLTSICFSFCLLIWTWGVWPLDWKFRRNNVLALWSGSHTLALWLAKSCWSLKES